MIRNKLTQDILKKAGAHTPREAFAVLSVNGEYFGFCEGAMLSRVVSLSVSLTWQASSPLQTASRSTSTLTARATATLLRLAPAAGV